MKMVARRIEVVALVWEAQMVLERLIQERKSLVGSRIGKPLSAHDLDADSRSGNA